MSKQYAVVVYQPRMPTDSVVVLNDVEREIKRARSSLT